MKYEDSEYKLAIAKEDLREFPCVIVLELEDNTITRKVFNKKELRSVWNDMMEMYFDFTHEDIEELDMEYLKQFSDLVFDETKEMFIIPFNKTIKTEIE